MSSFTFEYVYYTVNNSGFPQLILNYPVSPPSNWQLTIPSTITNSGTVYTVVAVANSAFRGSSNLINCFIPDSVTSIAQLAFYDCINLTSIRLSNSLLNIGDYVFPYSYSLRNIVIPNSVTNIDGAAFAPSGLLNVFIPASVTSIGGGAFQDCPYLRSVVFLGDIPLIEGYNFNSNTQDTVYYKSGTYNNNIISTIVPSIFTYAVEYTGSFIIVDTPQDVSGTSGVSSATISWSPVTIASPNVITKYQICHFITGDSSVINTIDVSANITQFTITGLINFQIHEISVKAFSNLFFSQSSSPLKLTPTFDNSPFTFEYIYYTVNNSGWPQVIANYPVSPPPNWQLTIPQGITRVGAVYTVVAVANSAFRGSSNLINCFIPDSVTSIAQLAFYDCINLTSIRLSNSLLNIGDYVFPLSYSLTNIVIPNSVTNIDGNAFATSGLVNVVIGSSVTSIGGGAFGSCSSLTSVIFLGTTIPTIDNGNFTNSSDTAYVHPNASGLSNLDPYFNNIVTMSVAPPQDFTGTSGNNRVTLNWSASVSMLGEITKYQISYFVPSVPSGIYNNTINTTTPWGTGNNGTNIAIALTADEKRAIRTSFNNSVIYLSSYNSTWSGFTQITDNVYRNYSGLSLNADGSRGVACCGITGEGYIYYFTWNGTTYSTLTQILDTTSRNYLGISLSDDGSVLVVSSNTGIYFATWNGTNYSVLTKTLENRNISFIAANVSGDGLRIVYGADETDDYVYWADWNGTNFNNGTRIDNTIYVSRGLHFASDKNIIWLTSANYTRSIPFLYYTTWNGTTYNPFTGLSLSSIGSIDGWGLWVNSIGNNVYLASYNTGSYYKFNVPTDITTFTTLDVSGNITQKVITGLTNNQNYSFTVKAFINDTSSTESSTLQVMPFSIGTPQNVTGTAGANSAIISWTAVTAPLTITKYQISYYDITDSSNITRVDVSGNITQKVITGLSNFATFEFSVKVFIDNIESGASSTVQVTPYSIDAPQNVTGTAGVNSATISWSAVSVSAPNSITKYQISYYDVTSPSSITTADVSGNVTQSVITGLTNFVTYGFSVKAFITTFSSVASTTITVELSINNIINTDPTNITIPYSLITSGITTQELLDAGVTTIPVTSGASIQNLLQNYDFPNVNIASDINISNDVLQSNTVTINISNLTNGILTITNTTI